MKALCISAATVLSLVSGVALAGVRILVADRDRDALYVLNDTNSNGVIDEPGEVVLWFSSANSAGTLGPMNPTSLATELARGGAVMGDQINRNVYLLRDSDHNGDAQGASDSKVAADAANLDGASFAFPTGAAFDGLGRPFIMNAGNAFGPDELYRLAPMGDCDAQDGGEIFGFVAAGFFGPGNGPYSPQEVFFDGPRSGYFRNSSSGLFGVFRFRDTNADDDADDAGECVGWWTSAVSGITPSAGFPLEPDLFRPGSMYTQQTITGGVDQFIRLTDLNGDGDANDAGEAVLVYATPEAGFTPIDLVSLPGGDLLVSDNSGIKIYRLHDIDGDGLFTSAGERTIFFANSSALLLQVRQINLLPPECPGDANGDRMVGLADIAEVINGWAGPTCLGSNGDLNGDGAVGVTDVAEVINNWGNLCPIIAP